MSRLTQLELYLKDHPEHVSPLVDFDSQTDKLFPFDFSSSNQELSPQTVADTSLFSSWISNKLQVNNCRYGLGGYNERRMLYSRSELFNNSEEPRRLHLGVDIWAEAGTPVYAPLSGQIHSFRFNDAFGDYGATLILEHDLDGLIFYSLYGHLSLSSISGLQKGAIVKQGEKIAEFGIFSENGNWPPHLHFQLILDMQGHEGDYPGVCQFSEKLKFLGNCPDPDILLNRTFS
ncbi:Peptidase family M23 [Daejeonella rubra]|uniref:Peptidase family M23 n=1 Tax=Daejeonella rubra TaxID=990371 RepID=A0A1G9YGI9_9SPHI|nr:peptidoglycan DD-metalloendopeptidase family protein [Daejeonella rubra]SDN08338.1 Peptidase family M23 [Daejeonella rubra]